MTTNNNDNSANNSANNSSKVIVNVNTAPRRRSAPRKPAPPPAGGGGGAVAAPTTNVYVPHQSTSIPSYGNPPPVYFQSASTNRDEYLASASSAAASQAEAASLRDAYAQASVPGSMPSEQGVASMDTGSSGSSPSAPSHPYHAPEPHYVPPPEHVPPPHHHPEGVVDTHEIEEGSVRTPSSAGSHVGHGDHPVHSSVGEQPYQMESSHIASTHSSLTDPALHGDVATMSSHHSSSEQPSEEHRSGRGDNDGGISYGSSLGDGGDTRESHVSTPARREARESSGSSSTVDGDIRDGSGTSSGSGSGSAPAEGSIEHVLSLNTREEARANMTHLAHHARALGIPFDHRTRATTLLKRIKAHMAGRSPSAVRWKFEFVQLVVL